MRQLRFVKLADDGRHLVVAGPEDGEHFAVLVEPALHDVVRTVPAEPAPPTFPAAADPEPEPAPPVADVPAVPVAIVPREIQIRVRAGESPEDVAASLGVDLDRIARFASPVVEERRRIADEARRARARRSGDGDGGVVVFGEAVDARFGAHGIDATTVGWDSHRREDGEWVVRARWVGGDSEHDAEWIFHRGTRSVTPLDDTATDLLSDRPIRPIAPPQPTGPPRLVVAPPLTRGVVAFPPMPDAHTAPISVITETIEEVFDQEAADDAGASELVGAAMQPMRSTPRPALLRDLRDRGVDDVDAPPLPLGIADPLPVETQAAPARQSRRGSREPSDEDRAARARIPSWDDILLGVRRKTD